MYFLLGGGRNKKYFYNTILRYMNWKKVLEWKKNVQDSLIKVKQTTIYKLFSRDIDTRIKFQTPSVLQ